jgi:amidase
MNRPRQTVGDNSRATQSVCVKALKQLNDSLAILAESTISALSATTPPVASIDPGQLLQIETTDRSYRALTGPGLDGGAVRFRELNLLTGPIAVNGAEPGDALGFSIHRIEVGSLAYVPYIARWRYPEFPLPSSSVQRYPIRDGLVRLSETVSVEVEPMVGCVATAPAVGTLSSLSPAERTGGNLDIERVRAGATIWLPVETESALVAIGDIHAAMGTSEPLGAGLECSGTITGVFHIARSVNLTGPRIESEDAISFVGSHPDNDHAAKQIALRAAWDWLVFECRLAEDVALAICAALLSVTPGGPAGCNFVASFDIGKLGAGGISTPLLRDLVS